MPPSHYTPEPDASLRARYRDGDVAAIDELAQAFFHDALRFAHAIVREEELAFDAVQETFLRLIERHRLYDPERPWRPWLFAICRNCCLGLVRDRERGRARVVDMADPGEEIERLAADFPLAWQDMIVREREAEVLAALATLDEARRSIVVLHLFEGLAFREVADIVGRPPATVATLYYRTLAALRGRLGSDLPASRGEGGSRHAG